MPASAFAQKYFEPENRLDGALVLSGGGARGAYEAGWIEGLRSFGGVPDGEPLPGIGLVCGTSIGSINGWFLATGQYSRLATLWRGIGADDIFRLKRRFAATASPHAFIITKIVQALSLAQGLTKNVRGLLDGDVVQDWIQKHMDPDVPLVCPFIFTTTNLDRRRPELFYMLTNSRTSAPPSIILDRVRHAVGDTVPLRLADRSIFTHAMRASTAIPVLFDPLVLPSPEGTMDRFVDGGISDNNPIDVGRALARNLYLILTDPSGVERQPYANALEIALGAFGVAQQRIFDAALHATREEREGKRLFANDSALTGEQRHFLDRVLDSELFIGRPAQELPAQSAAMDRQDQIDETYALGFADAQRGWHRLE